MKEEINIFLLLKEAFKDWKVMLSGMFTFLILGILYLSFSTEKYKSVAHLTISESLTNQDNFSSNFGGLASLAGLNMAGSPSNNDPQYVLNLLNSLDFFEILFKDDVIAKKVYAYEKYDFDKDKILFDRRLVKVENDEWQSIFGLEKNRSKPSTIEIFEERLKKDLAIFFDNQKGLIAITYEHVSPAFSAEFISLIIERINEVERTKVLKETQMAIDYIQQSIAVQQNNNVKIALARILESQLNKNVLAAAKEDYLVEVLQKPLIPEKLHSPKIILVLISSLFLGIFFSLLISIFRILNEQKS